MIFSNCRLSQTKTVFSPIHSLTNCVYYLNFSFSHPSHYISWQNIALKFRPACTFFVAWCSEIANIVVARVTSHLTAEWDVLFVRWPIFSPKSIIFPHCLINHETGVFIRMFMTACKCEQCLHVSGGRSAWMYKVAEIWFQNKGSSLKHIYTYIAIYLCIRISGSSVFVVMYFEWQLHVLHLRWHLTMSQYQWAQSDHWSVFPICSPHAFWICSFHL